MQWRQGHAGLAGLMIAASAFGSRTLAQIPPADEVASSRPVPVNDGLKVWITRGGDYCIRDTEIGKLRCQRERAWAKEGVTFSRRPSLPPPMAAIISATPPR